jgi:protein TonB
VNLKSFSTLQIALGISVAVHAVLLAVRFVDPEGFNRVFQDTPLEVILVNTRTSEKPDKNAKAIAQTSLAGGGDAEKGRATSPLPPSALTQAGDASEDVRKQAEVQFEQQMLLLAQKREELSRRPPELQNASQAEVAAFEEKRRQSLRQLAEIERRIQEENAKPRRRYVTPSTREEAYAIYYDNLRRKIEDRGTRNFPEANGRKLYGELLMRVTVTFDGRVFETVVEHSSGNKVLDRRAQQIALAAGPFGPVSANAQYALLKSGYNRLAFLMTFRFHSDGSLETQLTNR